MPKAVRSESDINSVKEIILAAALEIIFKEGFNALSMRKIGTKTSMTAANIYNYFSNKDEIYLSIQQKGFDILNNSFNKINRNNEDPYLKLQKMIKAYIDFGTANPDLYEVMFTRSTPKYSDYVGTELEATAITEKETALMLIEEATKLLSDLIEKNPSIIIPDLRFRVIQVWTAIHGVVSLYNSRVLQEVVPDTDEIFKKISNEFFQSITFKGQQSFT